ncbi:zinc finger CCCH domain-containing protein 44-like [Vicia villosa]|uniref:zinc finger CCCH domain-containing protein 44-like n=1 Tax=Vicia villosa TaxID=3911 RepID=UPI00273CEEE6|nr:zinc finger CCCH domain-containing protein 44-like [Vicia villosa]
MTDEQQVQPISQPVTGDVRVCENSQMIGVNVVNSEADVTVTVETAVKRKRGRPPRGSIPRTTQPPKKQVKDEEDVCFICFDGGSLVLCDHRGCPKAYHPACVKRGEEFFRATERWSCGWHQCNDCGKSCHYMCYTCTYSLCKGCTKKEVDFVSVRGNKGLCGTCMRTIVLIENSARGIKCEVDFDDKTSWEYLFKVYWMYLKGKLSLNFDEVLRAKSPWQGAVHVSCMVQPPQNLLGTRKVDNGYGSENSCIINSNSPINKKAKGNIGDSGSSSVGRNVQDLSTTDELNENKYVLRNQITPNKMAIHGDTNAGDLRLAESSVPKDILFLLHSSEMEQALWHYQDPTGKVHGPFSMSMLRKWKGTGYLPPNLRIWNEKQEKSILLTDALNWKFSQNVSLPLNHEQQSLGGSVSLENKENSQDGLNIATRREVCANNQIVKLIGDEKVADIRTQTNDKESVKSNGGHTPSPGLTIQGDGNICTQSNGKDESVKSNGGLTPSAGLTIQGDGNITNICTQSNGKDESVKSNSGYTPSPGLTTQGDGNISNSGYTPSPGLTTQGDGNISDGQSGHFERREESPKCEVSCHDATNVQPALPSTVFNENLNEKPSLDKVVDGNEKEQKLEENVNLGSNRSSEDPSNSGQSDQKQSDNEVNSGQSSGQNWRAYDVIHSDVNHSDVVHPPMDAPSWLAAIFGETDCSLADDSVSDLLEQVEANEKCGELESPAEWDEELTEGVITDCFNFANALSPMLDGGAKSDTLTSSSDLHLPSIDLHLSSQPLHLPSIDLHLSSQPQPIVPKEPFQHVDVHNHQVTRGEQSSKPPETAPTFSGISWNQFSWDPTR